MEPNPYKAPKPFSVRATSLDKPTLWPRIYRLRTLLIVAALGYVLASAVVTPILLSGIVNHPAKMIESPGGGEGPADSGEPSP